MAYGYWTVREAADYFGRPHQTIYTWIRRGRVAAIRDSDGVWVNPVDVLNAHTRELVEALAELDLSGVE